MLQPRITVGSFDQQNYTKNKKKSTSRTTTSSSSTLLFSLSETEVTAVTKPARKTYTNMWMLNKCFSNSEKNGAGCRRSQINKRPAITLGLTSVATYTLIALILYSSTLCMAQFSGEYEF